MESTSFLSPIKTIQDNILNLLSSWTRIDKCVFDNQCLRYNGNAIGYLEYLQLQANPEAYSKLTVDAKRIQKYLEFIKQIPGLNGLTEENKIILASVLLAEEQRLVTEALAPLNTAFRLAQDAMTRDPQNEHNQVALNQVATSIAQVSDQMVLLLKEAVQENSSDINIAIDHIPHLFSPLAKELNLISSITPPELKEAELNSLANTKGAPSKELFIFRGAQAQDDNNDILIAPSQTFYRCGGYNDVPPKEQRGEATVVLTNAFAIDPLQSEEAIQASYKAKILRELLVLVESHKKAGIAGPIQAHLQLPETDPPSTAIHAFQAALTELQEIQNLHYQDGTSYIAAVRVSLPYQASSDFEQAFKDWNKYPGVKVNYTEGPVDDLSKKVVDLPLLHHAILIAADPAAPGVLDNFVFSRRTFHPQLNITNSRHFILDDTIEDVFNVFNNQIAEWRQPNKSPKYFECLSNLYRSPTAFSILEEKEKKRQSTIPAVLHFFDDYMQLMAILDADDLSDEYKKEKYNAVYEKYFVNPLANNDLNVSATKTLFETIYHFAKFNPQDAKTALATISNSIWKMLAGCEPLTDIIYEEDKQNFQAFKNQALAAMQTREIPNNELSLTIDTHTPARLKLQLENECIQYLSGFNQAFHKLHPAENKREPDFAPLFEGDNITLPIEPLDEGSIANDKTDLTHSTTLAIAALYKLNEFYEQHPSYADWKFLHEKASTINKGFHSPSTKNEPLSSWQEDYQTQSLPKIKFNQLQTILTSSETNKNHQKHDHAIIKLHRVACKQQSPAGENLVSAFMQTRREGLNPEEEKKITKFARDAAQLQDAHFTDINYGHVYDNHHENTKNAFGMKSKKWNVVKAAMLAVLGVAVLATAVTLAVLFWPVTAAAAATALGISLAAYAGVSVAALAVAGVFSTATAIGASLFAHKENKGPVAVAMEKVENETVKRRPRSTH